MKNKLAIALTLATVLSVSAFFTQTINAQKKMKPSLCKVKKNNADFLITATEKSVKLKKGTILKWSIFDLHQGYIVVETKIGRKWTGGEILMDDTTCR